MADERSFPDVTFVEADTEAIKNNMVATYELISGRTLYPASPEMLFVLWAADIIIQQRALINRAAKRNVPRFADGEFLDSLAELFHGVSRLPAQAATTTIRFYISEIQPSAQLVPLGTRITATDGNIVFATAQDAYIPIGALYVEVPAVCQTTGAVGNGFVAGQISTIVDLYPFYHSCSNVTITEGGSDAETDAAFYKRMRESEDTYSTAGSIGAYKYFAKSVNSNITDVTVTSPSAGNVNIYVLMNNGQLPGAEIISAVDTALSADDIRPLTDNVTVAAPSTVSYNIEFTYYIPSISVTSVSVIEEAVAAAVAAFKSWQSARMGRDINPSKLIAMLMETGIKRLVLTSPAFASVSYAQVAAAGAENIVNGGYEDE